jgi:hypothetical protein
MLGATAAACRGMWEATTSFFSVFFFPSMLKFGVAEVAEDDRR